MKTLYNISLNHRAKLVIILSGFILFMMGIDYWQTQKMEKLQMNFTSIYSDRLVPATELHFIANQLFDKQMLLAQHAQQTDENHGHLAKQLRLKNNQIDSLIYEYEKTYFVAEERGFLNDFKSNLAKQKVMENNLLHHNKQSLAEQKAQRAIFQTMLTDLNDLANIQTSIGQKLIYESNLQFAGSQLIFNLRMVIVIIVSILAFVLAKSLRLNKDINQPYHLN